MTTALAGEENEQEPPYAATDYMACSADPVFFTHHYCVIDNAQDSGETEGQLSEIPFRLWRRQAWIMGQLLGRKQVIILKARQLGISWLVCAYVLWMCLTMRGRTVLLFSKGQREADELIRRITVMFARLPWWLKARFPDLTTDNTKDLKWSNGSSIKSMPATASAGVSYTASLIVLDEAAHMKFGRQLYAAAKPTIDGGGQIILLSTANGLGGFFHNIWSKAEQKLNTYTALFLPWWSRPGRDLAWYDRIVRDADDPSLIPQEYPANPVEAFVGSGRLRFDPKWVGGQWVNTRDPLHLAQIPPIQRYTVGWPGLEPGYLKPVEEIPRLRVYQGPVFGRTYVIGGDVAEGKDPEGKRNSDFDAGVVLDEETWEEVAALEGRWEPDVWACYLMSLSEIYNQAVVVVERNNHGHATLLEMKHKKFPFDRIALGHDGYPGWLTNAVTKPHGVTMLAQALRLNAVTVRSRAALAQFSIYQTLKNGTTGAPSGEHDDIVSAWIVILSWLRAKSQTPSVAAAVVAGDSNGITNTIGVPGYFDPYGFDFSS